MSAALGLAATGAADAHLEPGHAQSAGRQQAPAMSVYVVQGVPGESVTVAVDGRTVQRNVQAKDIVGPVKVSPGSHMVEFTGSSWSVGSTFSVQSRSVDAVLHWPADPTDEPVVTVYDNDLSPVPADNGRVTVAHTAVVPPADIRVNGDVLFENIANGEFLDATVPAGTYAVEIVPTGQTEALFGPVDLTVEAQQLTRVFAIGAPTDQSMDAIVQTFPLGEAGSSPPDTVDAGSAGLAATTDPPESGLARTLGWAALVLVGSVALVGLAMRRLRPVRAR
jgi:hypothetical protein